MTAEIAQSLGAATFAATVALAAVLAARRPLRRWAGAAAAYTAWLAVPLAVAASLAPLPRALTYAAFALPAAAEPAASGVTQVDAAPLATATLVVAIWLAGAFASLALVALRQARFDAALGPLRRAAHGRWHASHATAGPFVTGVVAPRIVLPDDFRARYTARERRLILAHEGEHVRRGDVRVNAFAAFVRGVFWFHPLVHVAYSRFRLDQELARDANVLARFPEARRCYASAMLKTQLAGTAPTDRRLPLGCGWSFVHPIQERIDMLKHPLPGRARRRLGACAVALLAAGVAFGAGKPAERTNVDARLAVRIDGGAAQNVRLIGPLGEPFEARLGDGADAWRMQFVVTNEAPGMLRFAGEVHRGDALVSKPTIVMREGLAGQIQVTTADGADMLDVEATLERTDRTTPDDKAG